jgi:hypothetical protein
MKFWDDGQPNSDRIRNVNFSWNQLKKLTAFLKQNEIKCDAFLYDFSPNKIIEDAIHIPYPIGVYNKAEKTNVILNKQDDFDFMMMVDCDAFFDINDYDLILDVVKKLNIGDVVTFDLAKLDNNLSDYIDNDTFIKSKADWSYAYSGNRENGPLHHHMGSLGGVYLVDAKLLLNLGGFDEKYKGWGGEDGDMMGRILSSQINHNIKSIRNFSPFHLPHFSDWGNVNYAVRFTQNKKVKFITSIYSDLHGTAFGGRPSRGGHYRYSLLSILKIKNADFVCYTSQNEIESLRTFFYDEHQISREKLIFKVFDLNEAKFKSLIDEHKNIEETMKSDRCIEIQYNKFHWWWNEDMSYDYYYWIDAGLSHCGLFPDKYLTSTHSSQRYYETSLFNDDFLNNLIDFSGDKFMFIGKDNTGGNYWSGSVDPKWYNQFNNSIHIIGGLFGGHKSLWKNVVEIFENYVKTIIETDKSIYMEEVIMSLMHVNHNELFIIKKFDTWWHSNNTPLGVADDFLTLNKSFYKIFEELNKIYE